MQDLLGKIRRGISKPPSYIAQRVAAEIYQVSQKYLAPRRAEKLDVTSLVGRFRCASIDDLWGFLAAQPYVAMTAFSAEQLHSVSDSDQRKILDCAGKAMDHTVNLLGSGEIELGPEIDWLRDYKSDYRWEPKFCRDIKYGNLDQPSDVKFPWELSRMQWMIPLGQAYILSSNEKYAAKALDLVLNWIAKNPHAHTVNWACTMDVALRAIVWTWLFHVFSNSDSWRDTDKRYEFLKCLYLHGDFIGRNMEVSDVNGNHYTADAAGLVFVGLFFSGDVDASKWCETGWQILSSEILKQTHEDGVNFESSTAYHRLVQELFLFPAIYRRRKGLDVPAHYSQYLRAMARYTAGYSRHDGSIPLWGDADDARTLPFGSQDLNDHRYLLAIVGLEFGGPDLTQQFGGSDSEVFWLLGSKATERLKADNQSKTIVKSLQFPHGGFYVMRNAADHVFIDCGPIGLAGRGGHGHNDLLSFEAVINGEKIVTDCGAYQYTGNYVERNAFRSTSYHNTPMVDGEEINRFIRPDYLWNFHEDAKHSVRRLVFSDDLDEICIEHDGYCRLASPVTIVRTIRLDHKRHSLSVHDQFEGTGVHDFRVPLHLDPDVIVEFVGTQEISLNKGNKNFILRWNSQTFWTFSIEPGRVSPSYGVAIDTNVLTWCCNAECDFLSMEIAPRNGAASGAELLDVS